MTKSLPERLHAASTVAAARNMPLGECVCELNAKVGSLDLCDAINSDDDRSCSCFTPCLTVLLDKIADEIERDYIPIPRFAKENARERFVDAMLKIAREMDVVEVLCGISPFDKRHLVKIYCEPKLAEADTLEAIEDDATMPPRVYCREHGIDVEEQDWDYEECFTAMTRDLLRRQREVLERDTDE